MLVNALRRFRESLRRVTDGTEAFLILTLFILCLDKVSTDHAKLVPLGKVSLISLADDLSLLSKMAALESCPKHNRSHTVEKTEGIFWTSAKSKTINNVRHITAKVAGKFVSISKESIRTDLIFDDANGIDTLPNQAIFDAIQLMGYEGDLTDEGASSERLSNEQLSPSAVPTSEVLNESLPDSSSAQPKPTGENLGDHSSNDTSLLGNEDDITLQNVYDLCLSLCKQVSDQAKEIKFLKAKITKLKKQAKPVIKHHKAYLKSVSLQQRFLRNSYSKKHMVHKESVSKQRRKIAKVESLVQRDPLFDVMPEDKIDHMETKNAQISTDKEGVSIDFEKVSTDRPIVSTDGSKVSTDEQVEGYKEKIEGNDEQAEGTEEIFEGTEEQRQEKEKGVELKDVEETDNLGATSTRSLHIKPLSKSINPKDKGKKKNEE
ncbi:hypothetical protein Tco_1328262 [Tanacetum coccineum]